MNKRKLFIFTIFLSSLFFICGCKMEYNPNNVKAYVITFSTEKGKTPEPIALAEGAVIQITHLPMIFTDYFVLDGWYSGDEKIEPGYVIHKNLYLKAKWSFVYYDYVWTDTSKTNVGTSGSTNFTTDGEYTKVQITSKANSIRNWGLRSISSDNVYGFEIKVKCDSNINWAGLEWFNTSGFDCYYFEVYGDGSFKLQSQIDSNWNTILNLKPEESNIIKNDFNTIKLSATRSLDFQVYINGKLVKTIKKDELQITPGPIYYAFSASKTGSAWLKLMSYQKIK